MKEETHRIIEISIGTIILVSIILGTIFGTLMTQSYTGASTNLQIMWGYYSIAVFFMFIVIIGIVILMGWEMFSPYGI